MEGASGSAGALADGSGALAAQIRQEGKRVGIRAGQYKKARLPVFLVHRREDLEGGVTGARQGQCRRTETARRYEASRHQERLSNSEGSADLRRAHMPLRFSSVARELPTL